MAGQIGMLSVLIDAQTAIFNRKIEEASSGLHRKFAGSVTQVDQSINKMASNYTARATQIEKSTAGLSTQFGRLQIAAAGFFTVAAVSSLTRSIAQTADGYANVGAKLALVTDGTEGLAKAQQDVFEISQRTFSSLDSTATLASRTQRALVSNGADAAAALTKSLQLTETIQKAFAVSGATQQESSNAIIQLSQGLAAGALRGEEFNSVAEQGSRITQALAKNLGVTTGELRAMAKEGKLTAEVVVDALSSEGANIAAEFEKLPLTISRSMTLLDNAWTKYIGDADQASGVSRSVAESIASIGRNLDPLISGMTTLAAATALVFGGRALQGVGEYSQGLLKAVAAQSAMVEMERLAATAAVETARARSIELTATLDAVAAARQDALAKKALVETQIVLAQRHLDAAKAAGVQSFALREQAIATEQLMAAQLRQRAVVTELAVLGAQQASLQGKLADASAAQVAAQGRLAGALTTTQVVMQGLSKAGSALFTMIGGWPTVALAAAYGLYKLWDAMAAGDEQAQKSIDSLREYNEQVAERLRLEGIQANFGADAQQATGISEFLKMQEAAAGLAEQIESAKDRIKELSQSASEASSGQILALQSRIETLSKQLESSEEAMTDWAGELSNLPPVLQEAITGAQDLGRELASMFGMANAGPVVAEIEKISDEAQKFIDKSRETRETLGLSAAQLTMYNAAMLAAKESTQAGKDAIIDEASALAQAQIAQEAATEAKRNASKASKEYESDSKKLEKQIKTLSEAVADGAEKITDLADSYMKYLDPMDQAAADFTKSIRDIGRAAEEEAEKIEKLRAASGDSESADSQLAHVYDEEARAIANATAAHDQRIASIEKERDITSSYLEMLSDEARLIGLTSSQARVETTVLRALAEAKKLNAAAGKEVAKVDEARIRQQARLNEALNAASSINQKSPIFAMIDQARELGIALEQALKDGADPKHIQALLDAIASLNSQVKVDSIGSFKALLGAVQTFTKEGSQGFKNIEKGMAALSIIQDIIALKAAVSAVLTQGQGDPYSAFARMAAMAAAVAPFIASIGLTLSSLGGGSFSDTAGKRQATQGTGTILGDAEAKSESIANAIQITADATSALVGINRGMLRALIALQDGLGGAANQLARGAGDADFSGLNLSTEGNLSIWEQNDLIGRLIGGSSEITDQGIIIMGGALNDLLNDIAVGAYQEVQSQSSFFGSTHTNEGIVDVSDELGRQFQLVIGSIVDTVREGAEALGLLPADIEAALAAFQVEEIRISLMDLSAEEQQAELAAVFSSIFDGLAGAIVPFVAQFQQVGEGLGETLIRVATGVQVTQEAMRQLGLVINETDPERFAQISEGLIGAVGGIEEFIEGMNSFVSAFADDGQRLQIATEAINSAFEQAGLTVPATAEGMWALMQSLDATTEAGQEQIATLLRLADTAAAYYDLIEKAERSRLEYIRAASELQIELNEAGGFLGGRSQIEEWTTSTIQTLNDLARAAGRAGASEQDLVNVHRVAAQRLAQLIEQLKGELRDLAATLGYTTAGGDTLESLNAQIESMGSASGAAADAIGAAVDSMREKMNLLLGDLSPFNDQKKLELALEGLRAGTVDPEQVLEIGRRLYASTSNYTNLFNQVMGMAQFGRNGGGSTSQSDEQGRTLAELIAARDALLAAQRPELAEELARRIAELSYATGEDFAAIAQEQGFTLEQLGADLNLNGEQLNAYLEQLQSQFEAQDFAGVGLMIEEAINRSTDRIVEAITGKPSLAIEESDQRMADIAAQQKADRAASDERVVTAINGLTSALVSSGVQNADRIVDELGLTRRDLREDRLAAAGGNERGRGEFPVRPR